MKKLLLAAALLISYVITFAQTPQIGHFQTLATVRRGDTLDVTWFYRPGTPDVRTFQVDWQYKKTLLTYLSTTVDACANFLKIAQSPSSTKSMSGSLSKSTSNGLITS